MSRDGSGNYVLPSGNPVVTNTVISSTWANATLSDIGAALTQSLSKDGQTTPTANLSMGNFRLTALAAAVARTDAPNAGQVQDGGLTTLASVSGTDTVTASSSPAITAYTAGQCFDFVSAGANTTVSVTLNINGLGAKNVTKNGASALAIGDIRSGQVVSVLYDGTRFQMISPIGLDLGRLLNVQVFTANGTYNPTAGTARSLVHVVGGGGGAGAAPITGVGQVGVGSGGAAGGYTIGIDNAPVSRSITVGLGGNGGVASATSGASAGNTGGSSSYGAVFSAPGGTAGTAAGPSAAPFAPSGNSSTAAGATGNILNAGGAAGGIGWANSTLSILGGAGAPGPFGGGANPAALGATGIQGNAPGCGGSGSCAPASTAAGNGGRGADGIVMIYEYGAV